MSDPEPTPEVAAPPTMEEMEDLLGSVWLYIIDPSLTERIRFVLMMDSTVEAKLEDIVAVIHAHGPYAENERLRETLNTAYLLVKVDATDAPGRISTAIRPFLEAAVAGAGSDG